ncbi:MAG: class I SAM-dependent methyltransferase [Alphaproteobacteria bacterium]|jgi:predicted O-methyltransferase YrrM|nr:class I SAM-dependent methyltransferase [Alphaproteobacteria bacterium]MBN9570619.1 class I SAM-dependent methyltransferase [Alphaproteobacteria bacterium]MBN9578020.1 class I SAM-dependent methyltransferase [Alphaproteobacteria bacterium]
MKSDLGLSPAVEDFVSRFGVREHPVLLRCRAETRRNNPLAMMQIGEDQGAFMGLLARLMGAARYLEIGVFTGYSTLAMALALPENASIVALDISREFTDIARGYWDEAGVSRKIDLRIGPALESLDRMIAKGEGPFDMAFIDADKTNYDNYYERVLQLLRPGGLIALDNMLWSGKVATDSDQSPDTVALRALNARIHADTRVDIALVTVADGIMLARKK